MISQLLSQFERFVESLLDLEDRRPVSSLQPSAVKLPAFGKGLPRASQGVSITG